MSSVVSSAGTRFYRARTGAGSGVLALPMSKTLNELARQVDSEKNYISHLTVEQEREVVGNAKLFLVAVCTLNHMTLEQILATYDVPKSECIQLLLKLDKIKFLELMPNNRIRLK